LRELRRQDFRLGATFQVALAVAGVNPVEQANPGGQGVRMLVVRSRGEMQLAPEFLLRLEIGDQRLPQGQGFNLDRPRLAQRPLQAGPAVQERPKDEQQGRQGTPEEGCSEAFVQQVCPDQRAVEVHHQGEPRGDGDDSSFGGD
jgi:hypothetical protein